MKMIKDQVILFIHKFGLYLNTNNKNPRRANHISLFRKGISHIMEISYTVESFQMSAKIDICIALYRPTLGAIQMIKWYFYVILHANQFSFRLDSGQNGVL